MDYIQINKFSDLHGPSSDIRFCKTDYISAEFKEISELDTNVVLVTGNSDYAIPDQVVELAPKNIKVWYAQNALSNHDRIEPLPIGIENKELAKREGHGIGYFDRVNQKEKIFDAINTLSSFKSIEPKKFIYANFVTTTNPRHRNLTRDIAIQQSHIDWEEPNLSLEQLFLQFLRYKMVLCPIGNGIDTHRLWETLYCNRVPVTIKVGDFKLYSLYEQLPIVILDNYSDLLKSDLISQKYQEAINKKYDKNILSAGYWKNKIRNSQ